MITKDTTPAEAVKIAIEKEKNAHHFYTQASKIMSNPATKAMFEELAEEEIMHLHKLEILYEDECFQED